MPTFFVYTHTRFDTNEVFYVGIGTVPKSNRIWQLQTRYARAYCKAKRTKFWKNVVSKTRYGVSIVFESDSRDEVRTEEIRLIAQYGKKPAGTLVNFRDGGEGNPHRISYGIRVTQMDMSGRTIKVWEELKDIQSELKFLKTNIVKCCRKTQISAYGFKWEYTDNRSFDGIKPLAKNRKALKRRAKTEMLDKAGNLLHTFDTIQQAADFLKVHPSTISNYKSGKRMIHPIYDFRSTNEPNG